jgi:hypothetical protein
LAAGGPRRKEVWRGRRGARERARNNLPICACGQVQVKGQTPEEKNAWFERLVSAAVRNDWVVYAKPPFGGPEQVLKYLARYTHRAAISNSRLLDFEDGFVGFRYKDYAHGKRKRVMKLSASEFVRRFLLHVLPRGFVRIRYYGLLSNRHREQELKLCRQLLAEAVATPAEPWPEEVKKLPENPVAVAPTRVCPRCSAARMSVIGEFPPLTAQIITSASSCVAVVDSS